jgi:starch phosphorylase
LPRCSTTPLGEGWVCDLDKLRALADHADDPQFQRSLRAIKHDNKERLAALVEEAAACL